MQHASCLPGGASFWARARLTGVGSGVAAATSMLCHAESVESGCASAITLTMLTIARSLPVWQ
jgi:hypothetical protein